MADDEDDRKSRTSMRSRKSRKSVKSIAPKKTFREHAKSLKAKFSRDNLVAFCKNFSHFLFSTLGLCLLVILYSISGSALFTLLEQENEKDNLREYQTLALDSQDEFLARMLKTTAEVNCNDNLTYWQEEVDKLLTEVQTMSYANTKSGWDGTFPGNEIKPSWEIVNSYLYAITIITTIGYGHIAPKTPMGMIFTVIYATLGVPIALLYLANMGSFMADLFRFIYHRLCCDACCPERCLSKEESEVALTLKVSRAFPVGGKKKMAPADESESIEELLDSTGKTRETSPSVFQETSDEDINHLTGDEKSVDTNNTTEIKAKEQDTTVGGARTPATDYPDAGEKSGDDLISRGSEEGIPNLNNSNADDQTSNANYSNAENEAVVVEVAPQTEQEDEDIDGEAKLSLTDLKEQYVDWKSKYRYMSVPVSLTVLVMVSYLFIGAVIFSVWEKWNFIPAFYFSFITLTTIGLGDLVPGLQDADNASKPLLSAIYLLVGLALIAMCIDLMQAEIKTRVVTIAQKVGIIQKPEDKLKKTDAQAVFAAIQN